jgi:hypothetical protein
MTDDSNGCVPTPTVAFQNATGAAGTAISLQITDNPGAHAEDDSEQVYVLGVPPGAILSAGDNLGNGVYSLTLGDLTTESASSGSADSVFYLDPASDLRDRAPAQHA